MKTAINIITALTLMLVAPVLTKAQTQKYCTENTCYIVNTDATDSVASQSTEADMVIRNLSHDLNQFLQFDDYADHASMEQSATSAWTIKVDFATVLEQYEVNPEEVLIVISSRHFNQKGERQEDRLMTASELKEGVTLYAEEAPKSLEVMFLMSEVSNVQWKDGYAEDFQYNISLERLPLKKRMANM